MATPAPRPWAYLANDQLGRAGIGRKSELHGRATRALQRPAQLPEVIRGFFHDPSLAYIGMS
ncbi:MAG: hypothetical protein M3332_16085 [Actinomycetota bacterium]|nr:hypothetical protein [Actinomycetota bacterium]